MVRNTGMDNHDSNSNKASNGSRDASNKGTRRKPRIVSTQNMSFADRKIAMLHKKGGL